MACLSAALGVGWGILTAVMVLVTTNHERNDHFTDYTYWAPDDGIRYPRLITSPADFTQRQE